MMVQKTLRLAPLALAALAATAQAQAPAEMPAENIVPLSRGAAS